MLRAWDERSTGLELNLRRDYLTQSLCRTEQKSKRYRKGRTELLDQNHRSEMDSIYSNKGWFNPPGTGTLFLVPVNSLDLQAVAWPWVEVLEHVFILVSMCQSLELIVYREATRGAQARKSLSWEVEAVTIPGLESSSHLSLLHGSNTNIIFTIT